MNQILNNVVGGITVIEKRKNKSIALNAFLNSIKTLNTILFPIITYPYITRVLSIENIGRINFGQSIVSYFSFIAAFGINTYAIRNGSRKRDNFNEFQDFINQIFTINIITTLISCIMLLVLLAFPTKIAEYKNIILIQAIMVAMLPLSLDWIYTIYEDFGYITLRSFLVQLLSLCLMFVFVKDNDDIYLYVSLVTIANCLGNVFNFYHSRKYVKLRITKFCQWDIHGKPLLIFFINSIASTIYLNSGTTILGLFSTDYCVGLYSVASKIYMIAKQMFNAVISTTIPRLAYLQKKDNKEFENLIKTIINITLLFLVPASLGIIILCKEIILIISGAEYIEAANTLAILACAILFAVLSNIVANGILICIEKEKYVVRITVISALVNIISNIIFVPMLKQNAVAFSTVLAELIVIVFSVYGCIDIIKSLLDKKHLLQVSIASGLMFFVSSIINLNVIYNSIIVKILITVLVSVFVYCMMMLLMVNSTFMDIILIVKSRLRNKK